MIEILPTAAITDVGVEPGGVLQVTCLTQLWPSPSNPLLSMTLGTVSIRAVQSASTETKPRENTRLANTAVWDVASSTISSKQLLNDNETEEAAADDVAVSTRNGDNGRGAFADVKGSELNVMTKTALAGLVPPDPNGQGFDRFIPRVKLSPELKRNRNITASAQVGYTGTCQCSSVCVCVCVFVCACVRACVRALECWNVTKGAGRLYWNVTKGEGRLH